METEEDEQPEGKKRKSIVLRIDKKCSDFSTNFDTLMERYLKVSSDIDSAIDKQAKLKRESGSRIENSINEIDYIIQGLPCMAIVMRHTEERTNELAAKCSGIIERLRASYEKLQAWTASPSCGLCSNPASPLSPCGHYLCHPCKDNIASDESFASSINGTGNYVLTIGKKCPLCGTEFKQVQHISKLNFTQPIVQEETPVASTKNKVTEEQEEEEKHLDDAFGEMSNSMNLFSQLFS